MDPDRARELTWPQLQFRGGYNGDALRLILGEAAREHGRGTVDALMRELDLEQALGLRPGTDFSGVGRWPRRRYCFWSGRPGEYDHQANPRRSRPLIFQRE